MSPDSVLHTPCLFVQLGLLPCPESQLFLETGKKVKVSPRTPAPGRMCTLFLCTSKFVKSYKKSCF